MVREPAPWQQEGSKDLRQTTFATPIKYPSREIKALPPLPSGTDSKLLGKLRVVFTAITRDWNVDDSLKAQAFRDTVEGLMDIMYFE